jgi:hypothetical protein
MKRIESAVLWGVVLVLAGVFLLLQNLGVISELSPLLWAIPFAVGGVIFLGVVVRNPKQWWAAIPASALLGIALVILADELAPKANVGGSLFLVCLAAGFVFVYLLQRDSWGALIPAGVLLTLGVVAGLNAWLPALDTWGIFFIGVGLTFAIISLVPTPEGRLKWAVAPAIVLAVMGLFLTFKVGTVIGFIWPLALIAGGGYLVYRALGKRPAE